MTKNKFTLGIELEGVYRNICQEGGYGSQNAEAISSNWNASEDSSIESDKLSREDTWCEDCETDDCGCIEGEWYGGWQPVEVVSNILNLKNYKTALKEFQELAQSGDNELYKDVEFNESTGCHIHFKVSNKNMRDFISVEMVDKFHTIFTRRLRQAIVKGLIPERVGRRILQRYYRGYAPNNKGEKEGRHSLHWSNEFGTLEWRSFNLTDVKSWKTFHNMFDIAIATIDEAINRRFQIPKTFEIRSK